jgi:hypothetical protein
MKDDAMHVRIDGQELLINGMAEHLGKLNQKRHKKKQIHHLGRWADSKGERIKKTGRMVELYCSPFVKLGLSWKYE